MAVRLAFAFAVVAVAAASSARAQSSGTPEATAPAPEATSPAPETAPAPVAAFVAPRPLQVPRIGWPEGAPPTDGQVQVKAQLRLGVDGAVVDVKIVSGAGEPFDGAVVAGARQFRFTPALSNGRPVEVLIPFTQTFVPPRVASQAPSDTGPARTAILEGVVREKGTRKPAVEAVVSAAVAGHTYDATTDAKGAFRLALPPGDAVVHIEATGAHAFLRKETLKEGDDLAVKYLVELDSYDPYEAVVEGERERVEVSRTQLRGRELTQIPGTFGDPYRVISVLPGVSSVMSLLPLPVVRGSSPGDTGLLLDGQRVPLLFHLFGGPSVIHPEFIDRVDFYPGGFPVDYGGYTAGIVDGITRRARPDESKVDLDLNLLETGFFARHKLDFADVNATVAGRIGYPGVLLSLANLPVRLSYWDYQARLDGKVGSGLWTMFFYGARDALSTQAADGTFSQAALFEFHRGDLRYTRGDDENGEVVRLVGGYDTTASANAVSTNTWNLGPQLRWYRFVLPQVQLRAGADFTWSKATTDFTQSANQANAVLSTGQTSSVLADTGPVVNGDAWTEARWHATDALLVIPALRAEAYQHSGVTAWDFEPRLMARWKLTDQSLGGTTLKGAFGWFHQPPRLPVPVPGVDEFALNEGLLQSIQSSVGAEVRLGPGVDVDVTTYYNDNDPIIGDLTVNPTSVATVAPTALPGQVPTTTTDTRQAQFVANFFKPTQGRAYGLEVLLRKRDSSRVFGWLAYTLSQSERLQSDGSWASSDFDRTQIVNLVVGTRLPRNWELGGRLLFQTGTPLTTIHAFNGARTPPTFRFDLRIDKRAVWNEWLLDFYVDIVNTTIAAETGGLLGANPLYYVLPTLGLRAVL